MLDQAFEALKKYDWGTDTKVVKPIDDAVIAAHGDAKASKELEARLAAVLKTEVSRDAKDYVCRKLMLIGTADSVPALAELLPEKDHSHMARFALERIPAPEAAQAMREALPKVSPDLKIGVISSLGVRQDAASVTALEALLGDSNAGVAAAAAFALGSIRTAEAATALASSKPASEAAKAAVTDASLACAEGLLTHGKKAEALVIYKGIVGQSNLPKHVRLAATRGMLACAGKN
ncbi:MAG: HEAT repeat domain-containing protein [Planctomycetes bacterium]|nr:HEAT repeat domain-containing protein [Planctomycetota bacterium]